jgi:hypothetical protein
MNPSKLEYVFRPTFAYRLVKPLLDWEALRDWKIRRRPPAPRLVKEALIRRFARLTGIRTFIETGTFFGDMVAAVEGEFSRVFSIELEPALCRRAAERFRTLPHVTVVQGNSGTALGDVLGGLDERCLFWLDGHFSGGVTARGPSDTPVRAELAHILRHPVRDHVVLIDDARLFGSGDYPTVDELSSEVRLARPELSIAVEDDIIRIARPDDLT